MLKQKIDNLNVLSQTLLLTPEQLKQQCPLTERAINTVLMGRETVQRILDREDPRLLVVVGPCSIHDLTAAREYASKLKTLADEVQDTLFLVMRVYFEKPRTTIGWKGFINDPLMDDSFHIEKGLLQARELLLELAEMGLAVGTEALDPIAPQFLSDLVSWYAIGARTTESQTHREMSSGLSTPVGFKNGTDGNLQVAVNALHACANPHHFLGINQQGQCALFHTRGNDYGHIVMRGGARPNYDSVSIRLCEQALKNAGLAANIVVDCSHSNSLKDPNLQPLVLDNCASQIIEGNQSIVGVMIESNLASGNQPLSDDLSQLRYGVSITDACIDWPTTETLLRDISVKLQSCLPQRMP